MRLSDINNNFGWGPTEPLLSIPTMCPTLTRAELAFL
jgi:hypothetical protein